VFHSPVFLYPLLLSLCVNIDSLVTFVNEASAEWEEDESGHESLSPITSNAFDPSKSPAPQPDTRFEATAGAVSFVQQAPTHHRLEPAHTSSPSAPDGAPTFSLREASLVRRFIQKIAPWVSELNTPLG
jgi:hypothetical protein